MDQGTKPAQGHSPLRILRLEGGRLQAIPFALDRDTGGGRGINGDRESKKDPLEEAWESL